MPSQGNFSKQIYYQPSGKIGDFALMYWVLVSSSLLPLAGAAYAFIIWWIPITFFNPLITYLFSIALTILHNLLVIEYGHVRNFKVARHMGQMAFIITLVAHWIVWLALTDTRPFQVSLQDFLTSPSVLWYQFIYVYQHGTWWGPGGTWHGWILAAVWIIETALLYSWFISSVRGKVQQPYSETSQRWYINKILPPTRLLSDAEVKALKNGNSGVLASIEKGPAETEHSEITLFFDGDTDYYVSIVNKKMRQPDDSRSGLSKWKVVEYLHIKKEVGHHLKDLLLGRPSYLLDKEFKKKIFSQFGFTYDEIKLGEQKYQNTDTDTLRNRLVWVDKVWHPRLGQKHVMEIYGHLPNTTLVALICFIQHEPANETKIQLARRLIEILNSGEEYPEMQSKLLTLSAAWEKVEPDSTILDVLRKGFGEKSTTHANQSTNSQKTANMPSTEFPYKCRPGYGSKELLIEIDGASDEFFLQDFLNIISELHPRAKHVGIDEMHTMLLSGDVEWEGETDFGKISFHQDVYGNAFIMAKENDTAILKIDDILNANERFTRIEVNFDDYKLLE